MPTLQVFTPRSTGIGVATGALVAVAFGQLVGAAWGLAVLSGLAAGSSALAGSICMGYGRFAFLLESAHQRQLGVGMLGYIVMAPPVLLADVAIGTELFKRGDEFALKLLFGLTGITAYTLAGIMGTLAHLDPAARVDPRLRDMALPTSEGGPMPPVRAFTARSTGIGIATGVLVATALAQLLGAAWGLAILNGLAAGALYMTFSISGLRGGWFETTDNRRRPGIRALAYAVVMAPALLVHHYVELRSADEVAVSLLFMLTGFAAYTLGGIMATLVYLDGDAAAADLRLYRVTPQPGARRGS
jgi:hypothetical protein